ncbi:MULTISPECIES: DsbA family oxidoreductase [Psychrobacter]|uniref:DsbA family oxidoreductase n=1 Tax=Psychrobacter TaxID=497 RepID=UPI003FD58802
MINITIYSDYVCPFCLLAEQVVSDAIGKQNISINWRAFELRPYPVPTLKPEDSYLPTIWQESVYPLAERLGVAMQLPTISPQPRTAKAFELLVMAQDKGLDHEYSMRVLRAFFQENQDIGDTEILVRLATEVGLNANDARSALNNGIYAERHREALRHAREDMTITSVPTIVIGKQVFRGTPSIEQLQQAIDQFEANDDSKNNNATSKNV